MIAGIDSYQLLLKVQVTQFDSRKDGTKRLMRRLIIVCSTVGFICTALVNAVLLWLISKGIALESSLLPACGDEAEPITLNVALYRPWIFLISLPISGAIIGGAIGLLLGVRGWRLPPLQKSNP